MEHVVKNIFAAIMRARVISFMQQNKACLNGMENYPFLFWLFLSYSFSFSYEFFLSLLVSQFISYSTKIQSPYSINSKKAFYMFVTIESFIVRWIKFRKKYLEATCLEILWKSIEPKDKINSDKGHLDKEIHIFVTFNNVFF